MVNYGIQSAALVFPEINLEVRVNIELRDQFGHVTLLGTTDEVVIAKLETVKAVAELLHYEYVKELKADKRSVAEIAKSVLKGAMPTIVQHDQLTLNLFDEALENNMIEAAPLFRSVA